MLYHICENHQKILILTVISAMQGKPVHKGGWAKGGQGGPHKRPWWQVKTVPDVKKIGAKSILGSNPFGKVPMVFFFIFCLHPNIYTRKSNPFHGFLNGLTPVCQQCVPALNISPLKNFTAFQLNDLHYYLYAGG